MSVKSVTKFEQVEAHHFDQMAEDYDRNYHYHLPFHQYKIRKKIQVLRSHFLSSQKKINILEIGCGTGEYTQHLAKEFPHSTITAIDISAGILAVAKKKCRKYSNIRFEVQSAYKLPYKAGSFDLVCGFYILHHLKMKAAVREVYRMLKSSGSCFFYEPNLLNPLVWAVKSIPFMKKLAGDSPDEWAINPLSVRSLFRKFQTVTYGTSEYLPTIPLDLNTLKNLDRLTNHLSDVPGLGLMGGSVWVMGQR